MLETFIGAVKAYEDSKNPGCAVLDTVIEYKLLVDNF